MGVVVKTVVLVCFINGHWVATLIVPSLALRPSHVFQLESCRLQNQLAGLHGVNALVCNHMYIQTLDFTLVLFELVDIHSCIIILHTALLGVYSILSCLQCCPR